MTTTVAKSAADFINLWSFAKWGIQPELLAFPGRSPELSITELAEMMDAYVRYLNAPETCAFCGEATCDCPYKL